MVFEVAVMYCVIYIFIHLYNYSLDYVTVTEVHDITDGPRERTAEAPQRRDIPIGDLCSHNLSIWPSNYSVKYL